MKTWLLVLPNNVHFKIKVKKMVVIKIDTFIFTSNIEKW